jgi:uncharacterized damage-inducible protein DinB
MKPFRILVGWCERVSSKTNVIVLIANWTSMMPVAAEMVDVKKLLNYNERVRHRYFKSFTRLSWGESTKNSEASFHSIRNIFVHTVGAMDYWLDFLQTQNLHSNREYNEYKTFEQVRAYMKHVEKPMHDYVDSLSIKELNKTYKVMGDNHRTFKITAEDVLIHVFEEEVHHRGELIALIWQMGIEPPPMG